LQIQVTKKDLLWSYLGYFFNLGVNIILLPFILHFLSQEELGVWYVFGNIYAFVTLVDFGFSPTFLRNLTYAWSGARELRTEHVLSTRSEEKPNYYLFALVFETTKRIFFYMSLVVLFLMLTVGFVHISLITKSIRNSSVMAAYLIYSMGGWVNLFFNYRILALKSIGAYKSSQQALVLSRAVQLTISGIGVALGGGLVVLSCSYVVSGFITRLAAGYFFKKEGCAEEYLNHKKRFNIAKEDILKTFKILWVNSKKAGIFTLAQTVINQSGLFLCSAFIGIHGSTVYGLCSQLVFILCTIGEIFFSTSLASLTNARIKFDILKQQTIFSTSLVILWGTMFFGIAGLSLFGPALLNIIRSNTSLNIPMLIVMGAYLFLQANCSLYTTFISLNNTYPFVRAYILAAGIQLLLFLFLILSHRLTLVSILGVNFLARIIVCVGLKWPFACLKELDMTPVEIIKTGCAKISSYARGLLHERRKTVYL
jgi:O-antigen/teichoic acid export membrane protein